MRNIRYILEAVFIHIFYYGFKALPPEMASNLGGWLARTIGPRLAASRKALANIARAFPHSNEIERQTILVGMWDNLGRVFAEYPHLKTIARDRTVIESSVDLDVYKSTHKGAVFASAHYGNWEISCAAPLFQLGLEIDSSYRAPNNPWVEGLLLKGRTLDGVLNSYPKSRTGGRGLLKAAQAKRNLIILFDQKYNEGIGVSLFGQEAMTNPVFVQIGQKYDMDALPMRVVRDGPARLRLLIEKPLRLYEDDETPRPHGDVIQDAHQILERWITEHPGHWLWLHRRWKD